MCCHRSLELSVHPVGCMHCTRTGLLRAFGLASRAAIVLLTKYVALTVFSAHHTPRHTPRHVTHRTTQRHTPRHTALQRHGTYHTTPLHGCDPALGAGYGSFGLDNVREDDEGVGDGAPDQVHAEGPGGGRRIGNTPKGSTHTPRGLWLCAVVPLCQQSICCTLAAACLRALTPPQTESSL